MRKMRKSGMTGRKIYTDVRPNRFILFLKGIVLTAFLIMFVLLMQGTWSVAKSMWPVQPETVPAAPAAAQPVLYEPAAPAQDFEYTKI